MFEKVKGALTICLVCFKTIKTEEQPKKRLVSWPRVAVAGGALTALVACSGIAMAAFYEWHEDRQALNAAPALVPVAPPISHGSEAATSDDAARFGNRPWYKGYMDRADSCMLMPSSTTPKADAAADGSNAYIAHADSHGHEYSIFYSDGTRTWVYASSDSECRHAVDSWIWQHTVGAAL
jgi:hypothetical protein